MIPRNLDPNSAESRYEALSWQERTERIPNDYDPSPRKLSFEEQGMVNELKADWAKGINWEIEWQNLQDELTPHRINPKHEDLLIKAGYF